MSAQDKASQRGIHPYTTLPVPAVQSFETSYQNAFFGHGIVEQQSETRGYQYTTKKCPIKTVHDCCSATASLECHGRQQASVERAVRCRAPPSTISDVLNQSKTTMKDTSPMSLTAFKNPKKISANAVRIDKIQQPSHQKSVYPTLLDNVHMKVV